MAKPSKKKKAKRVKTPLAASGRKASKRAAKPGAQTKPKRKNVVRTAKRGLSVAEEQDAKAKVKRDAKAREKRAHKAAAARTAKGKAKREAEAKKKRAAEAAAARTAKAKAKREAEAKKKRVAEAAATRAPKAKAKREAEAKKKRAAKAEAKQDTQAEGKQTPVAEIGPAHDQSSTAQSKPRYYITTAIAYPNGPPHIGYGYEVITTDAIARFKRLDGYDVFFLTGTDEHGIKIAQTAAKDGITPKQLVDRNTARS
jgi:methionyl-tRNA synthetase